MKFVPIKSGKQPIWRIFLILGIIKNAPCLQIRTKVVFLFAQILEQTI